jgi:hypothetical protein
MSLPCFAQCLSSPSAELNTAIADERLTSDELGVCMMKSNQLALLGPRKQIAHHRSRGKIRTWRRPAVSTSESAERSLGLGTKIAHLWHRLALQRCQLAHILLLGLAGPQAVLVVKGCQQSPSPGRPSIRTSLPILKTWRVSVCTDAVPLQTYSESMRSHIAVPTEVVSLYC